MAILQADSVLATVAIQLATPSNSGLVVGSRVNHMEMFHLVQVNTDYIVYVHAELKSTLGEHRKTLKVFHECHVKLQKNLNLFKLYIS